MGIKVSEFTAATTLAGTEIFYTVLSPFGSGDDRKITAANMKIALNYWTDNTTKLTTALTIESTKTTNQIILGTTNTITITSPAPTTSRVLTIPDPGGADSFVLLALAQTLTNKTLTSPIMTSASTDALTATNTSNQLVLGTTRTLTLHAPTPASSSRILTLPDPGGADSVAYLALAQTLTNKTLTTPIIASLYADAGKTHLVTVQDATQTLVGRDTTDTLTNKTFNYTLTNTITAYAGGGQANAVQLTTHYNVVTVVATTADSVKLLAVPAAGQMQIVKNTAANSCTVYPGTNCYINAEAKDAGVAVAAGAVTEFIAVDTTHWQSMTTG